MFLLSYGFGFGFVSRPTAEQLASTNSEKAIVAVLAPVCADKFRALPDVDARTATLVADKDDFYKMREAFPAAMITLPDKSYPDSDLTAACAALILAPPKTADLK
jgi:alpha/beta superfamily hydrolase